MTSKLPQHMKNFWSCGGCSSTLPVHLGHALMVAVMAARQRWLILLNLL